MSWHVRFVPIADITRHRAKAVAAGAGLKVCASLAEGLLRGCSAIDLPDALLGNGYDHERAGSHAINHRAGNRNVIPSRPPKPWGPVSGESIQ
jgi:hypothetical protein